MVLGVDADVVEIAHEVSSSRSESVSERADEIVGTCVLDDA